MLMPMVDAKDICYLCGKPLQEPINRDHVPPQQLYADEVRKRHSPNLLTIPVHEACNSSYQLDEDYFVSSLMPFAVDSYSGNAFYSEILRKYKLGERRSIVQLVQKILREFEDRPAGLILPPGKIVKRFDGERLKRVTLKIVRGLYFHHFNKVLPQEQESSLRIVLPDQVPPKDFICIANEPTHGLYPGAFDYRFKIFPEVNNFHYWAFLLWDRIILLFTFHDPACTCDACIAKQSRQPNFGAVQETNTP